MQVFRKGKWWDMSFQKAGDNLHFTPSWLTEVSKGMLYFWVTRGEGGDLYKGLQPSPTSNPTPALHMVLQLLPLLPTERTCNISAQKNDPLIYLKYMIKNEVIKYILTIHLLH